jgi:hypothetical protein
MHPLTTPAASDPRTWLLLEQVPFPSGLFKDLLTIRDLRVVILSACEGIRHGGQGSLRIATRVELSWSVLSFGGVFTIFRFPWCWA